MRVGIAGLAVSLSMFSALVYKEHYTETAVIPTKNDRPTVGFGSTFWEDGRPVRLGDKITPVRAVQLATAHITKEETAFRATLPGVEMHPEEYNIYMDWAYQYGAGAWRASSMRRHLLARNYRIACHSLLLYNKSGGFDCSIPGNRVCAGVWTRQKERHAACLAAQ
ncbi:glycoside hydrolase family protein [Massilia eurypsychrophila]|nr:lysozyme [Massilia eurypsychrophila]